MDISATYLGRSTDPRGQGSHQVTVRFGPQGMDLFVKDQKGGYGWDSIRRISFDDPGTTRPNVAAIVAFGVLGALASRRRAFTLMTVTTTTEDLYFEIDEPIGLWQTKARGILDECPIARGRLYIDGQLTGVESADARPVPTVAELAKALGRGWYPDPLGAAPLRWYNGANWTEHTLAPPDPAP